VIGALLWAALVLGDPIDQAASYPEGPLYTDQGLLVAEMGADTVYLHRDGAKRPFFRQAQCGPTAIAPYGAGYLVLCHLSREVVTIDRSGAPLRRLRAAADGSAFQDPNDCSADDRGGVYFSDPGLFSSLAPATGAIYRLDERGAVQRVAAGLRYPNGVHVDRAGRRLLVSEHLARRVLSFPIRPDGSLGEPALFADLDAVTAKRGAYREAGPDGLEITPSGEVVVAIYGEGRLLRFNRSGELLGELATPFAYVTNVAFQRNGEGVAVGAVDNVAPPFLGAVVSISPVRGKR